MRPITPQPLCPIIVRGWAGGYRAWAVIGSMLIGLAVIGLAGAVVIMHFKVSNKFENISGRDPGQVSQINKNINGYYQEGDRKGILDMLRMAQRSPRALDGIQNGGQDAPGLAGALKRSREMILYTDCQ